MNRKYKTGKITIIMLGAMFSVCHACHCDGKDPDRSPGEHKDGEVKKCEDKASADAGGAVDVILKKMSGATGKLKSYEAQIKYLVVQEFEDSRTLRKGKLYYLKDKERSRLRINFAKIKQDDEKEHKQRQEFIFDGVWLVTIDYQLENVQYRQLAKENDRRDVFELLSNNFPIVGFSKTQKLDKEFDISLLEAKKGDPGNSVHLHLKVKKDSIYKDKYEKVDFWVDKKAYLPVKIVAVSTEDDIYDIQFLKKKVNKKLKKSIFKVDSPKSFDTNKVYLKEKGN